MGLFDRLKGIKAGYDARKAEETKIAQAEKNLIKEYNLQRTSQPGRYMVGGDRIIDVNLRNPESIKAAREVLDKRDLTPTLRRVSPRQAKEYTRATGGGSLLDTLGGMGQNFNANLGNVSAGNYDFLGGGFSGGIGDYDFMGGGSPPRKKSTRKKSTTRRKKR